MKKNSKGPWYRAWKSVLRGTNFTVVPAIFLALVIIFTGSVGMAAPHNRGGVEMTPGPRMIRAIEALAHDYLNASDPLNLRADQIKEIRIEVSTFKKDIWRKEAFLTGMFEEVGLKRRYGFLLKETYSMTNILTGGIETDQMNRMLRSVEVLQRILTPEQKEIFRSIRQPRINLEKPEGFNLRIGLLALGQFKRAYGEYRTKINLTEAQKVALRGAIEAARREVIRIGTEIEISRTEAYDMMKEPIIDLKKTRKAMQRTANLEGKFFPNLSAYSEKFREILTSAQQVTLKDLHKKTRRTGSRRGGMGSVHSSRKSASLLDRAGELRLNQDQIKKLISLEIAVIKQAKQDEVDHRIQSVELEERLQEGATVKELEERIEGIVRLGANMERARLQKRLDAMKILDEKQKVALHTPHVKRTSRSKH